MRPLGFTYERYETSVHFMHLAVAIHSSKTVVVERIFCMIADFQSVAMPNISSGADALR